ncbi:MAG TPA: nitrogenase iron-molybdenum cofactor biosynthesis protein NifE [Kineosporiaceae bacterium]|nr:nitrogenase iron-molybdenum cofactor biosynthesis protein NifE [Kineosporiaceae bacterium]
MKSVAAAGVFEEPGCEHNRGKGAAERRAGCPAPTPGSAAGGCSFDGSMITLAPVSDVAHVVHGPIACAGNSWDGRGTRSSAGRELFRHGFTSDLSETELVLGGEQKLYDTVLEVAARHRPAAVFVYSTCVTALAGDDLDAVCAAAARATGLPVVPVHAPGFAGSKNLGNKLAGNALLEHVIGTREPEVSTPADVNLVGEYNIAGELWEVLPTLRAAGIRVLAGITGDSRYADVAAAHRARATMVVCSRALLPLARGLQERYGIPWFEGSFYGLRAMADSLRGFGRLLPVDGIAERIEQVIAVEQARAVRQLAPYRRRLAGRRAVLYTGGVKSWSMVSALQDVGIEVVASGATKSTEDDVEKMVGLLGPGGRVIREGNPRELLRLVEELGADILIAGGRNQYTALKARIPFLDVNQERHVPLAGYPGIVQLARQLDLALHNPVWDTVRAPAPWDAPEGAA